MLIKLNTSKSKNTGLQLFRIRQNSDRKNGQENTLFVCTIILEWTYIDIHIMQCMLTYFTTYYFYIFDKFRLLFFITNIKFVVRCNTIINN